MDSYIWGVILVGTLATFATRALPFVALDRYAQHPLLRFLGRYLPPVLMVLLVVYATADLAQSLPSAAIVALSTLSVALLQWRFKNPLISIFAGSLVYALMI
jgi:branched-subunit amino acid transport protein AzlD